MVFDEIEINTMQTEAVDFAVFQRNKHDMQLNLPKKFLVKSCQVS